MILVVSTRACIAAERTISPRAPAGSTETHDDVAFPFADARENATETFSSAPPTACTTSHAGVARGMVALFSPGRGLNVRRASPKVTSVDWCRSRAIGVATRRRLCTIPTDRDISSARDCAAKKCQDSSTCLHFPCLIDTPAQLASTHITHPHCVLLRSLT